MANKEKFMATKLVHFLTKEWEEIHLFLKKGIHGLLNRRSYLSEAEGHLSDTPSRTADSKRDMAAVFAGWRLGQKKFIFSLLLSIWTLPNFCPNAHIFLLHTIL